MRHKNLITVIASSLSLASGVVGGHYFLSHDGTTEPITYGHMDIQMINDPVVKDNKTISTYSYYLNYDDGKVDEYKKPPVPNSVVFWVSGGSANDTATFESTDGTKKTYRLADGEIKPALGLSKITVVSTQKDKKATLSTIQCYGNGSGWENTILGCTQELKRLQKMNNLNIR